MNTVKVRVKYWSRHYRFFESMKEFNDWVRYKEGMMVEEVTKL